MRILQTRHIRSLFTSVKTIYVVTAIVVVYIYVASMQDTIKVKKVTGYSHLPVDELMKRYYIKHLNTLNRHENTYAIQDNLGNNKPEYKKWSGLRFKQRHKFNEETEVKKELTNKKHHLNEIETGYRKRPSVDRDLEKDHKIETGYRKRPSVDRDLEKDHKIETGYRKRPSVDRDLEKDHKIENGYRKRPSVDRDLEKDHKIETGYRKRPSVDMDVNKARNVDSRSNKMFGAYNENTFDEESDYKKAKEHNDYTSNDNDNTSNDNDNTSNDNDYTSNDNDYTSNDNDYTSNDYDYFALTKKNLQYMVESRLHYSFTFDRLKADDIRTNEKLILLFTSLWEQKEWPDIESDQIYNITEQLSCPVKNCKFTYNKRLFNISDAVLFHSHDQKDEYFLNALSQYGGRPKHQRWIYFTSETPNSFNARLFDDGLFNMTMTYDRRSDIYLPYGSYSNLTKNEWRPKKDVNYAKGKKDRVLWFVSNCNMKLRNWLARQLNEYIPVDVGGYCGSDFENYAECPKIDGASNLNECGDFIGSYKFYLSFESRYCQDYITEKYWDNAIGNDVIPIVLGGADYGDPELAIPNSYINVQNFKSIKELGEYIQKLAKNDNLYNEYFKWKQTYKRVNRGQWPYTRDWVCNICKKLNSNSLDNKTIKLSSWWDKDKLCGGDRNKVIQKLYDNYWFKFKAKYQIPDNQIPLDEDGNPEWEELEIDYNLKNDLIHNQFDFEKRE